MNHKKIKHLSENISSLKTAEFCMLNWAFVGFESKSKMCGRYPAIRVSENVSCERPAKLRDELNEAIKPVLDKWINKLERELKILVSE